MPLQPWLPDVLRAAGLTVVEHPGWRTRDRPGPAFTPRAVLWHHDGSPVGDSPAVPKNMATDGANGAQLWVDRHGVWTVIAAGLMWHAGQGPGRGVIPANQGNTYAIGIETDHTTGEPWPTNQLNSLRRGTAAILRRLDARPDNALWGHKEYAPGRKPDPDGLDMNTERRIVTDLITGPNPEETDMSAQELLTTLIPRKGLADADPRSHTPVQVGDILAYSDHNFDRVAAETVTARLATEALAAQVATLRAAVEALAAKIGG
jgi:hypothetical protein